MKIGTTVYVHGYHKATIVDIKMNSYGIVLEGKKKVWHLSKGQIKKYPNEKEK